MLSSFKNILGLTQDMDAASTPTPESVGPVIVTLPKSGTDFIDNTLMQIANLQIPDVYADAERMQQIRTGYYRFDEPVVSVGNFDMQFANGPRIRDYVGKGRMVSMHMAGVHYNREALLDAGVTKTSVVMRDPRDSTISLCYHIRKAGLAQRNNLMMFLYLPPDYFDWPHERQLAFLIRTYLPRAVSWIESWLAPRFEGGGELEMQYLHFDDLKSDSRAFIRKIVDFHDLQNVDFSKLPDARSMPHFRSGEHDQWKSEFTPEQIEFADFVIGDRLVLAYRDAVGKGIERIRRELAEEDAAGEVRRLFALFATFPWVREAYDAVCEAAIRNGRDIDTRTADAFDSYYGGKPGPMKKPRDLVAALGACVGAV